MLIQINFVLAKNHLFLSRKTVYEYFVFLLVYDCRTRNHPGEIEGNDNPVYSRGLSNTYSYDINNEDDPIYQDSAGPLEMQLVDETQLEPVTLQNIQLHTDGNEREVNRNFC